MAANNNSCTTHSFGCACAPPDPRRIGRNRRFPALSLALSLLLLVAAGCATVKPYEREYLSRPSMDRERELTEAKFYTHVLDAREVFHVEAAV